MKISDLKVGTILSNSELTEIFQCGNMGGMRRSHKTNSLVLICDHTKGLYDDKWRNSVLHYTGMGKQGDQVLSGNQNGTLFHSRENSVQVHLLEVFVPRQYTYQGIVELAGEPYQEYQLDDNNNKRKVWMFPLQRLTEDASPVDYVVNSGRKESLPEKQESVIAAFEKDTLIEVKDRPVERMTALRNWDNKCCYYAKLREFLQESRENWEKTMERNFNANFSLELGRSQIGAWRDCFSILQRELVEIEDKYPGFGIVFEYALPYEGGRRPDVLLISAQQVIILEFKQYGIIKNADIDQTAAYARDIREYHYESRARKVSAILMLTGTTCIDTEVLYHGRVSVSCKTKLAKSIETVLCEKVSECDLEKWLSSKYAPLPTIVEAARMFMKHEELPNIRRVNSTCIPQAHQCLKEITEYAKENKKHILAMVTGVPGAGKTYLGLQYVYDICESNEHVNSVYLSGNGPLVKVLTDALKSRVFVKDLHAIVNEYIRTGARDFSNNVVVFDEGQRAWDSEQMKDKRGTIKSEPQVMIELCSKRLDWCVLLVLVGEGQEIHNGENGGLNQWNQAVNDSDVDWEVICPDKLTYLFPQNKLVINPNRTALDLTISLRTHLASYVSTFVNYIINGDITKAKRLSKDILNDGFSMYVTRDLEAAKEYVRDRYQGEPQKRYGLLASSKNGILPRYGMNNTFYATAGYGMDYGKWFNAPKDDPRSCCALNQVVTEFGCQGLEIDMPIIGWESDMRWNNNSWVFRNFRNVNKDTYVFRYNSYRVLLTRGRDGFVIFVPPVNELDGVNKMFLDAGVRQLVLSINS